MKNARTLMFVALAFLSGAANAVVFNAIQPAGSRLGFVVKEMGVPVDGGFSRFTAQMNFDPAKPAAASAAIDIDLSSIDAGSSDANEEALGPQWFNVKVYPKARFVTTSIRALGGNRYEAAGRLTIKGRTLPVTAPFTYLGQGNTARFDGALTIRRADFGIGEGEWADFGTVANEVQIKFTIQAVAQPAARK